MVSIYSFWAKSDPYCSLTDHLMMTGFCASELCKNGVLRPVAQKLSSIMGLTFEETVAFLSYIASLHDIGKAHPYFQAQDMSMLGISELKSEGMLNIYQSLPFRHEVYSAELLNELLPDVLNIDCDAICAISRAIGLHHQGKGKSYSTSIPPNCSPEKWKALHKEINKLMIDTFDPPRRCFFADSDAVIYLIMGVVILSDWIASDMCLPQNNVQAAIADRGLDSGDNPVNYLSFCALWPNISQEGMRGVQTMAEALGNDPAKVYIIEAPMGEGKSEAALYLAWRQMNKYTANGFYMALPTSATGNQMYKRVNDLFDMHGLGKSRLLHGTAWMIDDCSDPSGHEPEKETAEWLAPLRRAMLSRFAVGTVDQAMLSVMNVKYGVLRLLGLANKVLILDEIHAYDTYMQTIIGCMINWCHALEIPIVLLSATLPKTKKVSLLEAANAHIDSQLSSAYPLITEVRTDGSVIEHPIDRVHMHRSYDVELRPLMDDAEATAELAKEAVKDGGCLCVLSNTVDRAQRIYDRLRMTCDDSEILLFHARFQAMRRNEIERIVVRNYGKKLENRPKRSILVATQVMEQSIDADFDTMITDLAPIDLLLQRVGRVHRFDNTERPESMKKPKITVLTSPAGYDDRTVYPGILMRRTERLLRETPLINTPEMIRDLIESVYGAEAGEDNQGYEMWAKNEFKNQLEAAKAKGNTLPEPVIEYSSFADGVPDFLRSDDEAANCSDKTRIGDGSRRVVLIRRDELNKIPQHPSKDEAKAYLLKSVSIRTVRLGEPPDDAVTGSGLLKGVLFLPTDDGIARWGGYTIRDDHDMGIIIEKG